MEDLKKLKLVAYADGYNAGYGKKIMRVVRCKLTYSKDWVLQRKEGKTWLCLHELND